MLNILKKFFEFSGTENRKKFYTAIVLGIVEALAQAFKIPAIFLMVQGMVEKNLTATTIWTSFGILLGGLVIQIAVSGKSQMLQTEAGYSTGCRKRIEIASHLRYLPMGYFNANSLGYITSVTTNTMENLCDVATRVVMMTTRGVLEAALITVMLLFFDWWIGMVAVCGMLLFFGINHLMQKRSEKISPKKIL